jgi:hypothetical protein
LPACLLQRSLFCDLLESLFTTFIPFIFPLSKEGGLLARRHHLQHP